MKNINIILACVCSLFLLTGCYTNIIGDEDENSAYLTEEEMQQRDDVSEYIVENLSEDIVSSFEAFDGFCDQLREMPGVEDVVVKPYTQITLKMHWGSNIYIPLLHLSDPIPVDEEDAELYAESSQVISPHKASTPHRTRSSGEKKKFLMVVHPDFQDQDVERRERALNLYRENGFEVEELDFDNFTADFILHELPTYDVSFIQTHGYVKENDGDFVGLAYGDRSNNKRNEDGSVSGDNWFIATPNALAEGDKFKPNSFVFLASCHAMDNDKIQRAFEKRGLTSMIAFDNIAFTPVQNFYFERISDYLLQGFTLKEAYDRVDNSTSWGYANLLEKFFNHIQRGNMYLVGDPNLKIVDKTPDPVLIEATLKWNFYGDVDLHCFAPMGRHIYYFNKEVNGGFLDYDNRHGGVGSTENIYWNELIPGTYTFSLHYYRAEQSGTCSVRIRAGNFFDKTVKVKMTTENQCEDIISLTVGENGMISPTRASGKKEFHVPLLPQKK